MRLNATQKLISRTRGLFAKFPELMFVKINGINVLVTFKHRSFANRLKLEDVKMLLNRRVIYELRKFHEHLSLQRSKKEVINCRKRYVANDRVLEWLL